LLDERHVPLDHADSNYKGILTHVLPASPLLRPDRTFPANTALPLEECAADYAGKIRAIMGSDLPRFDIILFGMGEDGHIASLFPDREAINAAGIVTVETNSPKPPPNRISLTLPVINNTTFVRTYARTHSNFSNRELVEV
jgi:6-phosphogluconolactonase